MLIPDEIDHKIYSQVIRLSVRPSWLNSKGEIYGSYVHNNTCYDEVSNCTFRRLGSSSFEDRDIDQSIINGLQFNYSVTNSTT